MPKLIGIKNELDYINALRNRESAYNWVQKTVIVTIVLASLCVGYERAVLSYRFGTGNDKTSLPTTLCSVLYNFLNILLLVSAIFLIVALKRIRASINSSPALEANRKIMITHIILLLFLVFVTTTVTTLIFYGF